MNPKNSKPTPESATLDIAEWLASSPKVTAEDLRGLSDAGKALQTDPAFQADFIKARFVEDLLHAMAAEGMTKSQLAQKWGRTRQYLGKILDEDRRVNFTVETMTELALLLKRRLEVHILNPAESTHLLRCVAPPQRLPASEWQFPVHRPVSVYQTTYKPSPTPPKNNGAKLSA